MLGRNMIHQLKDMGIDKDFALAVILTAREEDKSLQMIDYLRKHPKADSSQVLDKAISLFRNKGENNNEIY